MLELGRIELLVAPTMKPGKMPRMAVLWLESQRLRGLSVTTVMPGRHWIIDGDHVKLTSLVEACLDYDTGTVAYLLPMTKAQRARYASVLRAFRARFMVIDVRLPSLSVV